MIRVLMTGATGYLGSRLLQRLVDLPDGYAVTILKRSFSCDTRIRHLLGRVTALDLDRIRIADAFEGRAYDVIVHAATDYGRKTTSLADIVDANLVLPLRLLEAGITAQVRTFINTDTMLDKRVSGYSLSKRQFREWLESQSSRVAAVNVSLEHFYGPGDDDSKFVSFIVRSLLNDRNEIALTHGTQRRDFVYIEDVVDAFMRIIEANAHAGAGFRHYEVGSGMSIPVRDFVETARVQCRNTATHLRFGAIPFRENEAMDVQVDTSALRQLGWSPKWSLQAGLAQTIKLEREHVCST